MEKYLKFKMTEDFQFNNPCYTKSNLFDFQRTETFSISVHSGEDIFSFFKYVTESDEPSFFPVFLQNGIQPEQVKDTIDYVKKNKQLFIDKKLILLILDPLEGHAWITDYIDTLAFQLRDICNVYFISGNKLLEQRDNSFIFYYTNHWVHHWRTHIDNMIELEKDHKIFISLNRLAREHRVKLLGTIIKRDLRKHGYISWTGYRKKENKEFDDLINSQTYDIMDVVEIVDRNPTDLIPTEYCARSFLWLNTETIYEPGAMFISEKSYKPMVVGMPFILLGNPGTLTTLKQLGFQTFDKWIDESYDEDVDLTERLNRICNELERFSKMTSEDRLKIREEMKPVLKHNKRMHRILQLSCDISESVEDIKIRELGK